MISDYNTIGDVLSKQDKMRLKMYYLKPCLVDYCFEIVYVNYNPATNKMWCYTTTKENINLIIDYPLFQIRFIKKELTPQELIIKLIIKAMETEDDLARNDLRIEHFEDTNKKIRDYFVSYGKPDRRMMKRFQLIMSEYIQDGKTCWNIEDKTIDELIKIMTI